MLKVLCLAQIFELEKDFGSDRHYYICRKLIESGHHVTVITSNIDYKTSFPKFKSKLLKPYRTYHNGIDIFYVPSVSNFKGSFLKRIFFYLSFLVFSLSLISRIRSIDLVYAISTPLTVGVLGFFFSKIYRAKFVFEVTDLWPDVFIEMGLLENRMIILLLKKMELFCYRKAEKIIALSQLAQNKIKKKINRTEKVILITNGVDEGLFQLNAKKNYEITKIRKKLGLEKKFICMYLGAHGLYNSLNTIIETARIIKGDEEIHFVFIGDGDEKKKLMTQVENYKLDNVSFFPPIPRNRTPIWLKIADVFLLPNLKGKFYEMNLQNKFFDFLVSARPIIFAGSGISAEIIEKIQCGKVVESENYLKMAIALKEIKLLSLSKRKKMGQNGKKFVLKHFNRNSLTKRLVQHFEELVV